MDPEYRFMDKIPVEPKAIHELIVSKFDEEELEQFYDRVYQTWDVHGIAPHRIFMVLYREFVDQCMNI